MLKHWHALGDFGAGREDISVSQNTNFITTGKAVVRMKYFYFVSFYFSNSASSQWAVCWTFLFSGYYNCTRQCWFHLNFVIACNYPVKLHWQLKNTSTLNHLKSWIDSGQSPQYTKKKLILKFQNRDVANTVKYFTVSKYFHDCYVEGSL